MMEAEDTVVEFMGGPYDGMISDGECDVWASALANFVLRCSDDGRETGKVICGGSPAGIQAAKNEKFQGEAQVQTHYYKVIDRTIVDGRVVVKVEYLPEGKPEST